MGGGARGAGMRLGVDLTFWSGTRGGTETYTRDLYTSLSAAHPDVDFVGIATSAPSSPLSAWFPGDIRTTRVGGDSSAGWALAEVLGVRKVADELQLDLLHCPANFAPVRATTAPLVLTLHDVNAFRSKPSPATLVTRAMMRRSFRVADAVITDSEWSAQEIHDLLPSSTAPVSVIAPIGRFVSNRSSSVGTPSRPSFLSGIPAGRPLLLSGGNRLPHKNWAALLRAMTHLPSSERPLLVMTGHGGAHDPLIASTHEHGLEDDVVLTGFTSSDDLEWLYRHAALYVLPTRYEGFGLGVLEAMSRGCPVLASDLSVLREVGAEAVAYVDTTDPLAMAESIRLLVGDPARRDEMTTRGLARAAEFSPEQTAARTWEVFQDVLDRGSAWSH